MKISYDHEIDALYIRLIEGKHECRTVRLSEEVALNMGAGEKLVGIEILDAKEFLGSGKVPAVILEGIASAAAPLQVSEEPDKKYGE
ncbi:MAG: DUF2283 domain-containing protein [Planctomycetota bacterium]|nr:DUF2283 domain-containing protein [Planctomycetota bacterium]